MTDFSNVSVLILERSVIFLLNEDPEASEKIFDAFKKLVSKMIPSFRLVGLASLLLRLGQHIGYQIIGVKARPHNNEKIPLPQTWIIKCFNQLHIF